MCCEQSQGSPNYQQSTGIKVVFFRIWRCFCTCKYSTADPYSHIGLLPMPSAGWLKNLYSSIEALLYCQMDRTPLDLFIAYFGFPLVTGN